MATFTGNLTQTYNLTSSSASLTYSFTTEAGTAVSYDRSFVTFELNSYTQNFAGGISLGYFGNTMTAMMVFFYLSRVQLLNETYTQNGPFLQEAFQANSPCYVSGTSAINNEMMPMSLSNPFFSGQVLSLGLIDIEYVYFAKIAASLFDGNFNVDKVNTFSTTVGVSSLVGYNQLQTLHFSSNTVKNAEGMLNSVTNAAPFNLNAADRLQQWFPSNLSGLVPYAGLSSPFFYDRSADCPKGDECTQMDHLVIQSNTFEDILATSKRIGMLALKPLFASQTFSPSYSPSCILAGNTFRRVNFLYGGYWFELSSVNVYVAENTFTDIGFTANATLASNGLAWASVSATNIVFYLQPA